MRFTLAVLLLLLVILSPSQRVHGEGMVKEGNDNDISMENRDSAPIDNHNGEHYGWSEEVAQDISELPLGWSFLGKIARLFASFKNSNPVKTPNRQHIGSPLDSDHKHIPSHLDASLIDDGDDLRGERGPISDAKIRDQTREAESKKINPPKSEDQLKGKESKGQSEGSKKINPPKSENEPKGKESKDQVQSLTGSAKGHQENRNFPQSLSSILFGSSVTGSVGSRFSANSAKASSKSSNAATVRSTRRGTGASSGSLHTTSRATSRTSSHASSHTSSHPPSHTSSHPSSHASSNESSSIESTSTSSSNASTNGTTTIDLRTWTDETITIGNFTAPPPRETAVPVAANFALEDPTVNTLYIAVNASSYTLGGLIPITLGGIPVLSGIQYVEAFKCQLNILNSNTRVLPYSYVTYMIQNTDSLLSTAAQQAYLLDRENVFMTVGPEYNQQVPPVSYLYSEQWQSLISYGAESVSLSNKTLYPTFFRTIPSATFQARAMAETMRLFGWNFVAALYTTDSYGQSGRAALSSQTGRQRIKVTCANNINPGSVSGLSGFADCVTKSDASVVVLWMDETNAANALSYLYQNASNSRLTFIASDRWALINDPATFNDTEARTNRSFPLSFIQGTLGFMPQIGQMGQYLACASQVNPSNVDYPEFLDVWESSFHCKYNSSDTIPPCPEAISERTFPCRCQGTENLADLPVNPQVNYVQDTVNFYYQTLDTIFSPTRCAKLKNSSICNLNPVPLEKFVQALSLVSISGLTGPIQFNVTQPDRRRSNFDIFQTRDNGTSQQIGFWNISGPFIAKSLLDFKTSPAYPVSTLVPDNTNFGNGFWPTMVAILSGIGIFLALCFLILFTVFARNRVVRRSNLLWLWLILISIILVLTSLILWTVPQSTFICTLKSIIGMLGFSLLTACFVVKVQRIFRVFINTGGVSMVMHTAELLFVVILVLIPDIILICIYIFGGGNLVTETVTQSTVDNTYVYISCTPKSSSFNNWIIAVFIGYNLLLIIVSTAILFITRKLQTAYDESEFMFLCLIDIIILSAIMVPLYFTVGDRRGSVLQTFLLRSLAVLFAMILTLCLIAYPKVAALIAQRKTKKHKGRHGEPSLSSGVRSPAYVEVSTTGDSESESDFTTASSGSKPRFISLTNVRKSGSEMDRSADVPVGGTGMGTSVGTATASYAGTSTAGLYNTTTASSSAAGDARWKGSSQSSATTSRR